MRNGNSSGGATLLRQNVSVKQKKAGNSVRASKVKSGAAKLPPRQITGQLFLIEEFYQNLRELPFDDAMAKLLSLRELIKHNPALSHYHQAIDNMVEGELALNKLVELLAQV